MSEADKLDIMYITIWHIGAIIVFVVCFMILYMKAKRTPLLYTFFYVQFCVILWMIAKVLKTVCYAELLRWYIIVLQYVGICFLEAAFLEFGYIYFTGRTFSRKARMLIHIFPIIQLIVVATNPYHSLFYSEYNFWWDEFGALFYVHTFIEYCYFVIGMVFCAIKFRKQFDGKKKSTMYILSTAMLAPILFNLIYISRSLERLFDYIGINFIFDITPIVFTWSLTLFIYATFKNEFIDLSPIMKHEFVYMLDTPICVTNAIKDIIYTNENLSKLLNLTENPENLNRLLKNYDSVIFNANQDNNQHATIQHDSHVYSVYTKKIKSVSGIQNIISFNDITTYENVRQELMKKNEELVNNNGMLHERIKILKETSHIGARNFVAMELHDIIGHSLTVAIKLEEAAKILYHKNRKKTIELLEKAVIVISKGFDELKSLHEKSKKNKVCSTLVLQRELVRILKTIESIGIETKYYFRGELNNIEEKVFDIIKRVCTELITNSLKYSKANRIILITNFKRDVIEICIIDNGIGCNEIKKGNGLRGIEERLGLINGHIRYRTNIGEGFQANIEILQ